MRSLLLSGILGAAALIVNSAQNTDAKLVTVRARRDKSAKWLREWNERGTFIDDDTVLVSSTLAERLKHHDASAEIVEDVNRAFVRSDADDRVVVKFVDASHLTPSKIREIKSLAGVKRVAREGRERLSVRVHASANATAIAEYVIAAMGASVLYVESAPKFKKHVVEKMSMVFESASAQEGALDDLGAYFNGRVVALSDTGIDATHCAFYDALGRAVPTARMNLTPLLSSDVTDTGHDSIRAYVSVCTSDGCATATDYVDTTAGHGTAMASIWNGKTCAASSDRGVIGNHGTRLAFFDLGVGAGEYLDMPIELSDMFYTAANLGARAMSLSWGAYCDSLYDDAASQVDAFTYDNDDFLMVVSAGNCGDGTYAYERGVSSPATAKNVLSVAAAWTRTAVASFSSIGFAADGRRVPLIAAPGVDVVVARAVLNSPVVPHSDSMGVSGTSPAAPYAAAALETLRGLIETTVLSGGERATAATMRAAAISTSTPITVVRDYTTSTDVPNSADAATHRAAFGMLTLPLNASVFAIVQSELQDSEVHVTCFSTTAPTTASVALAWNDPPATPLAARALINPVHVTIDADDGAAILAASDEINNHKVVVVSFATKMRVAVSSRAIFGTAAQKYSLVVAFSGNGEWWSHATCDADAGKGSFDSPWPRPCVDAALANVDSAVIVNGACAPQSCASSAFAFSAVDDTCVPSSSPVANAAATWTCADYEFWNFTSLQCECAQRYYVCADYSTIKECGASTCGGAEIVSTSSPTYWWQDPASGMGGSGRGIGVQPPYRIMDAADATRTTGIVFLVVSPIMTVLYLGLMHEGKFEKAFANDQHEIRVARSLVVTFTLTTFALLETCVALCTAQTLAAGIWTTLALWVVMSFASMYVVYTRVGARLRATSAGKRAYGFCDASRKMTWLAMLCAGYTATQFVAICASCALALYGDAPGEFAFPFTLLYVAAWIVALVLSNAWWTYDVAIAALYVVVGVVFFAYGVYFSLTAYTVIGAVVTGGSVFYLGYLWTAPKAPPSEARES